MGVKMYAMFFLRRSTHHRDADARRTMAARRDTTQEHRLPHLRHLRPPLRSTSTPSRTFEDLTPIQYWTADNIISTTSVISGLPYRPWGIPASRCYTYRRRSWWYIVIQPILFQERYHYWTDLSILRRHIMLVQGQRIYEYVTKALLYSVVLIQVASKLLS